MALWDKKSDFSCHFAPPTFLTPPLHIVKQSCNYPIVEPNCFPPSHHWSLTEFAKKIERAKRFSPCCQNKMFSFQQLSSFLKTKVNPVQLSLCSFCVCVSFAVAIWRPRPHATPIWWPLYNYLLELTRQTATSWQPRVNMNEVQKVWFSITCQPTCLAIQRK